MLTTEQNSLTCWFVCLFIYLLFIKQQQQTYNIENTKQTRTNA